MTAAAPASASSIFDCRVAVAAPFLRPHRRRPLLCRRGPPGAPADGQPPRARRVAPPVSGRDVAGGRARRADPAPPPPRRRTPAGGAAVAATSGSWASLRRPGGSAPGGTRQRGGGTVSQRCQCRGRGIRPLVRLGGQAERARSAPAPARCAAAVAAATAGGRPLRVWCSAAAGGQACRPSGRYPRRRGGWRRWGWRRRGRRRRRRRRRQRARRGGRGGAAGGHPRRPEGGGGRDKAAQS